MLIGDKTIYRTIRFHAGVWPDLGANNHCETAIITITLGDKTIFHGSLTGQGQTVDILETVPTEFFGQLPLTITVHDGGLLSVSDCQTNNQFVVHNKRYDEQTKSKFKSAATWNEKASIFAESATFTSEQLALLRSEESEDWLEQLQLLIESGWAPTATDGDRWSEISTVDVQYNSQVFLQPTQENADKNSLWHYVLRPGGVLSCNLIFNEVQLFASGKRREPNILVEMLSTQVLKNNPKILDIGVGQGAVWYELQKHQILREIHGLDITKKEGFRAADFYDNFIVADITKTIPLPSEFYDVVICSGVLGHGGKPKIGLINPDEIPANQYKTDYPVKVDADCLEEILRISRPGATLVFSITREAWHEFDDKLNQFKNSGQIKTIVQRWEYSDEENYMFPPRHMCMILEKIK